MDVVNLFYELARQNKRINGFTYGQNGDKGAGNEAHPLVWLDDPIMGRKVANTMAYSVNFDVLGIPANEAETLAVQSEAFDVGLNFIEKIGQTRNVTGFWIDSYTWLTLRKYTDLDGAGVRFSVSLSAAIPTNRCADDFDPSKQFPSVKSLPDFLVDNPSGCAVFNDKAGLPDFKLPSI